MYLIINNRLAGRESDGYLIDLHRRASDLGFNDWSIGASDTSQGRIQLYSYDETVGIPDSNYMTFAYSHVDNWLGSFDTTEDSHTEFRIEGLQVDHDSLSPQDVLTEPMQFLSDHLSVVDENEEQSHVWRTITPAPIFSGLTRRFALFFGEDKRNIAGNVFNDITGIDINIPTGNNKILFRP